MKKKKITLDTDVLNKVWSDWLINNTISFRDRPYTYHYRNFTGYGELQTQFKLWLQDRGGVIRKDHGNFVIDFTQHEHATFFILKYT